MTDKNKYHSLAVSHETYDNLGKLSKSRRAEIQEKKNSM